MSKKDSPFRHPGLGVDGLLRRPAPRADAYHSLWATGCYGRDDLGRLVYAERVCDIDAPGIHRTFDAAVPSDVDDRDRCRAQDCELLEILNAEADARPDHVHIFDLAGLTLAMLTRKTVNVVVDVIGMSNEHYPGSLGAMWIINAPFAFRALWAVIKPLLAASTLRRTFILGGPAEYVPKMRAAKIPLSALPTWTGDAATGRGTFAKPVNFADVVKTVGTTDTTYFARTVSPLSPTYAGPIYLADPDR